MHKILLDNVSAKFENWNAAGCVRASQLEYLLQVLVNRGRRCSMLAYYFYSPTRILSSM